MQVVYERCCGLDVHKRTVVACVLVTHPDGTVERDVQTFGTMTADLLALSDWLTARGIPVLAMESTGVYTLPTMLPKRWQNGSMGSRSCIATFVRV